MFKNRKFSVIFLSFLFLFSIVFFMASHHYSPDANSCYAGSADDLTVENNTPSQVKFTLTSSETQVVTITANSNISFNLKKGIYKWVAFNKETNKIISSGVINLNDSEVKNLIRIKE